MSFDEDRLATPSAANPLYCSGDRYRQCSPESCPGLTAQCTDRCVVVTCLDPHDGEDNQEVCGDIICDDQSCTDPTDCHGIYEFLQCCDDYHHYFSESKPQNLDQSTTATSFDGAGWDPALNVLLGQGYQHAPEHSPFGYYGMPTPQLTLTPDTVTGMTISSPKSPTPSTPSPSHSCAHPNGFQQNHHRQQPIGNHTPSFHNSTQPSEGSTFESNSPRPPDLSPVQPQSHLAVGQANATENHSCMWANCHAVFGTLQDLAAHVNVQHLQIVSASLSTATHIDPAQDPQPPSHHQPAPVPDSTDQVFPSCHWGDCHVYPTVQDVPSSSDRPLDAALGVLAAHLWEYHLGLPSPPPQFTFPSPTAGLIDGNASELIHSSSLEHVAPGVRTAAVQVEVAPHSVSAESVTAEVDPVVVDASSELGPASSHERDAGLLTQDEEHSHGLGHDCTLSDLPCKWLNCQERFASCEALMTHITAKHVGGGKNHYGCFWDGCGRNGDKGFKSKQKICRHLQSHTGHRPHQCEVCHQCFSEVATLQQHMRRHTQEKPYECDHPGCGKRFAIMGALTIHKRMHNGDKPFKCPQCDKAFSESSNLSKHLRTHTGARPYVCPEPGCGKCFGRGDQLTRHMNVHSGGGKVVKKASAVATTKVV